MKNETNFMMLFRFTPNFEYQPTEQEQTEMSQQWGSFIGNLAITEKLVSNSGIGRHTNCR